MSEIPPYSQGPSGYSPYPRDNYGGSDPYGGNPNQRPPGVYFDYIGIAWRLIQPNLGTWVLATLLMFVVTWAINLPVSFLNLFLNQGSPRNVANPFGSLVITLPLSFIAGVVGQVVYGGYIMMGVKQARNERIEIADLFVGFRSAGAIIGASFLTTLSIYLGIILLIIPGLFLVGLYAFVPLLIIDRKMGAIQALQECYDNLRSYAFSIFGLLFVTGLVVGLGVFACCVGLLFTVPLQAVVVGLTYNNFYPPIYSQQNYQQIGVEPPRY